jgi:uncharacterized protein YoxC
MDLTQILTVVLLFSAAALCIALIFYLGKITKSVQSLQTDIKDMSDNIKPLVQSTLELSENLKQISNEVKTQVNVSKSIVSDFRERADDILSIETKIRGGIEDAIMPLIQNFSAVGKGVETFWRNYKNK